ncbi:hypothetical protein COBT_000807 [Conglomerata obtusa]
MHLSEEQLSMLNCMFPNHRRDYLRLVSASFGNFDSMVDYLLEHNEKVCGMSMSLAEVKVNFKKSVVGGGFSLDGSGVFKRTKKTSVSKHNGECTSKCTSGCTSNCINKCIIKCTKKTSNCKTNKCEYNGEFTSECSGYKTSICKTSNIHNSDGNKNKYNTSKNYLDEMSSNFSDCNKNYKCINKELCLNDSKTVNTMKINKEMFESKDKEFIDNGDKIKVYKKIVENNTTCNKIGNTTSNTTISTTSNATKNFNTKKSNIKIICVNHNITNNNTKNNNATNNNITNNNTKNNNTTNNNTKNNNTKNNNTKNNNTKINNTKINNNLFNNTSNNVFANEFNNSFNGKSIDSNSNIHSKNSCNVTNLNNEEKEIYYDYIENEQLKNLDKKKALKLKNTVLNECQNINQEINTVKIQLRKNKNNDTKKDSKKDEVKIINNKDNINTKCIKDKITIINNTKCIKDGNRTINLKDYAKTNNFKSNSNLYYKKILENKFTIQNNTEPIYKKTYETNYPSLFPKKIINTNEDPIKLRKEAQKLFNPLNFTSNSLINQYYTEILDENMRQAEILNYRASEIILSKMNGLDFHGLTVKECLLYLEDYLNYEKPKRMKIITGRSERIRPAIVMFLKKEGFEIETENNVFVVLSKKK